LANKYENRNFKVSGVQIIGLDLFGANTMAFKLIMKVAKGRNIQTNAW
jgi:hypothetical protein